MNVGIGINGSLVSQGVGQPYSEVAQSQDENQQKIDAEERQRQEDKDQHNCEVRAKLGVFILTNPFIFAARIPYRIFLLFTGDFVRAGREFANKEWLEERQIWSLARDDATSCPGESRLNFLFFKYTFYQLIKSIAKIATLPFALIAMEFAAIYGAIFHPAGGEIIWSKVENLWSRDILEFSETATISYLGSNWRLGPVISDFSAPCLIERTVWKEKNIFRMAICYSKDTLRSRLGMIIAELNKNKHFYINEFGENGEKTFNKYMDKIVGYMHSINDVSRGFNKLFDVEMYYTHKTETYYLYQTIRQIKIAEKLDAVKEALDYFKKDRESIISLQLAEGKESYGDFSDMRALNLEGLDTSLSGLEPAWKRGSLVQRLDYEVQYYKLFQEIELAITNTLDSKRCETKEPREIIESESLTKKKKECLEDLQKYKKFIEDVVDNGEGTLKKPDGASDKMVPISIHEKYKIYWILDKIANQYRSPFDEEFSKSWNGFKDAWKLMLSGDSNARAPRVSNNDHLAQSQASGSSDKLRTHFIGDSGVTCEAEPTFEQSCHKVLSEIQDRITSLSEEDMTVLKLYQKYDEFQENKNRYLEDLKTMLQRIHAGLTIKFNNQNEKEILDLKKKLLNLTGAIVYHSRKDMDLLLFIHDLKDNWSSLNYNWQELMKKCDSSGLESKVASS